MNRLAMVLACFACSSPEPNPDQPLDPAAFHAMLASRSASRNVESVRIAVEGTGRARYRVTLKNSQRRRVVDADFPGTFVDEIFAARVTYSVAPDGLVTSGREKEISMTDLRERLQRPEQAGAIDSIRIEPTGAASARYLLILNAVPTRQLVVAYGEFSGAIVKAIGDAGIRYTVKSE